MKIKFWFISILAYAHMFSVSYGLELESSELSDPERGVGNLDNSESTLIEINPGPNDAESDSFEADAEQAKDIVKRANHVAYYQGDDGKAKVRMQIFDKQGRKRSRVLSILRKNIDQSRDASQKFYVYFHAPSDVRKTVFMVWKYLKDPDDRWLYLPALDLVKRVSASDERTSFVGSHFFYEDISGRNPTKDKHQLVEKNEQFFILKSIPEDAKSVEFSYFKSWIDRKTYLPKKIEYFNQSDKAYRVYQVLESKIIDGFPTVVQAKITDTRIGGYTSMTYGKVSYGISVPEDIFSERYLRKSPRKYLK